MALNGHVLNDYTTFGRTRLAKFRYTVVRQNGSESVYAEIRLAEWATWKKAIRQIGSFSRLSRKEKQMFTAKINILFARKIDLFISE